MDPIRDTEQRSMKKSLITSNGTLRATVALSALALFAIAGAAQAQTIIDTGKLPGGTYSYGGLLSDNGNVASGSGNITFNQSRGWRRTLATGLQNLGVSPGAITVRLRNQWRWTCYRRGKWWTGVRHGMSLDCGDWHAISRFNSCRDALFRERCFHKIGPNRLRLWLRSQF